MNRVISFNEYDELENVIFRMKQTSAVLDLVVRHGATNVRMSMIVVSAGAKPPEGLWRRNYERTG